MFHSYDPYAGRMMAVSKALSGGPVYLSDTPDDFVPKYIKPLCYDDGKLLRPIAPAFPLPDSVFMDPFADAKAFKVVAPLPNKTLAVVLYNLTEPEQPVKGRISIEDCRTSAARFLNPELTWDIPDDGMICYDWYDRTAFRLTKDIEFDLPEFGDKLLILTPIHNGWAIIGRPDKYLSPCAVEIIEMTDEQLTVHLKESGPLTIWSESGTLTSEDGTVTKQENGLWTITPQTKQNKSLRISRHS